MTLVPDVLIKPVPGIPLVAEGDDLTTIILAALDAAALRLQDLDVLVVSSKIVSKSEGCFVDLTTITPSAEARQYAEATGKDSRVVQVVLDESVQVSRYARGVLVTQHRLGFVSANAGIDQSNVGQGEQIVLVLPRDPDASADRLRSGIAAKTGVDVGIVISDSHGRPFRMGNIGVAIGVSGLPSVIDLRGRVDLFGRELAISIQGYADLIASAAHLVCGEADEGNPVILVRGLTYNIRTGRGTHLNRPPEQDLYR